MYGWRIFENFDVFFILYYLIVFSLCLYFIIKAHLIVFSLCLYFIIKSDLQVQGHECIQVLHFLEIKISF